MKTLVINEGNSTNLGDQAINFSMRSFFELLKIDNDFIGLTNSGNNKINQINNKTKSKLILLINEMFGNSFYYIFRMRWILKNFFRIYNYTKKSNHDIVFIGGGQLLLGRSNFPYAIFLWVFFLKKYNKKVILFSVGVGESFSFIEKNIFTHILNKVDDIYIRDYDSQTRLKNIFNKKSIFINDIAFSISRFKKVKKAKQCDITNIILSIPAYNIYKRYQKDIGQKNYLLKWKEFINKYLNSNKYSITIIYSDLSKDKQISTQFYNFIKKDCNNIKIRHLKDMEEMILNIANNDLIISGRMHPLIIGLSYEKKVIPFPINEKLISFEKQYTDCDINIDQIFYNTLQTIKNKLK